MIDLIPDEPELIQTDIAILMSNDPLGLSDQDITAIVEKLRTRRKDYVAGAKGAGKVNPKVATKRDKAAKASEGLIGKLDLGDLI